MTQQLSVIGLQSNLVWEQPQQNRERIEQTLLSVRVSF